MLLMDPTEAAEVIGARCGPSSAGDSPAIRAALRYITSAIEAILEVQTLEATRTTDVFLCTSKMQRACGLALTNAFVSPSTLTMVDGNGTSYVEGTDFRLGSITGVVQPIEDLQIGWYTVEYVSGFSVAYPEDPDTPLTEEDEAYLIAEGVPDWIKGMVIVLLVEWFRAKLLSPKLPDNIRMSDLMRALRNDLSRRMSGHYHRPRYGVLFPAPK